MSLRSLLTARKALSLPARVPQGHASKPLARNARSFAFVIEKSKGSWITDTCGNRYLDAFSSYSSVNFGHLHPQLYKAFLRQSQRCSVFSRTSTSDVLLGLAETVHDYYRASIVGHAPRVIPMNSGVEAAETAVKLARKRCDLVSR